MSGGSSTSVCSEPDWSAESSDPSSDSRSETDESITSIDVANMSDSSSPAEWDLSISSESSELFSESDEDIEQDCSCDPNGRMDILCKNRYHTM